MSTDNFTSSKISPATFYFGAKCHLARRINQLIPEHRVYVEPFAGGANVLLNKHRSEIEVINDLDPHLVNFYRILVSHTDELIGQALVAEYSRERFEVARRAGPDATDIDKALNYLILKRWAWSGVGHTWVYDDKRRDTWKKIDQFLRPVAERLRGVTILNRDALDVIQEYDGDDVIQYVDPPYYPSTRVSPKAYHVEMSAFDHLKLLNILNRLKSNIILSGYNSVHYTEKLKEWDKIEIETLAFAGMSRNKKKKNKRTEVLWVKKSWPF